eukprot:UC1_evm1s1688
MRETRTNPAVLKSTDQIKVHHETLNLSDVDSVEGANSPRPDRRRQTTASAGVRNAARSAASSATSDTNTNNNVGAVLPHSTLQRSMSLSNRSQLEVMRLVRDGKLTQSQALDWAARRSQDETSMPKLDSAAQLRILGRVKEGLMTQDEALAEGRRLEQEAEESRVAGGGGGGLKGANGAPTGGATAAGGKIIGSLHGGLLDDFYEVLAQIGAMKKNKPMPTSSTDYVGGGTTAGGASGQGSASSNGLSGLQPRSDLRDRTESFDSLLDDLEVARNIFQDPSLLAVDQIVIVVIVWGRGGEHARYTRNAALIYILIDLTLWWLRTMVARASSTCRACTTKCKPSPSNTYI